MSEHDEAQKDGLPYSAEERRIFEFSAGGRTIKADPLALERRIVKAQVDLGVSLEAADAAVRQIREAPEGAELGRDLIEHYHESLGKISGVALAAFRVPHVEDDPENGWTELEAMEALYGFYAWQRGVREDFTEPPSSATSTGSTPEDSTADTSPSSGSGSTATA